MEVDRFVAYSAPIVLHQVIVLLGLLHAASTTGPVPMNSDCRFWMNKSADDIQRRQRKWRKRHKVFYYWNTTNQECLPCTRCESQGKKTSRPCQYFRDSICKDIPENYEESGYPSYHNANNGNEQEVDNGNGGRLVYGGYTAQPVQFNNVWGVTKLHQVETGTESASRRLARVGAVNAAEKYAQGSPADFGKPSFYSKERKNSVQSYNRPVVDLIREMLIRNTSSSSQGQPYYPPPPSSYNNVNQSAQAQYYSPGSNNAFSNDSPALPSPPVTTEGPLMNRNKKQNVVTNTAYDKNMNRVNSNDRNWAGGNGRSTDFEREEKNWGPVNEYHKDRKESPRYNKKPGYDSKSRVGVEEMEAPSARGLVIHDQTSKEDGDYGYDDPEGYEYEEYESDATGEEEQEEEAGFGIAHSKMDPTTRSPGDEAFEELRHMIQGTKKEDGLGPLKLTLLLTSLLTGSLLFILIGIIIRNKIRAQRFKILNNSELGEQRTTPLHSITGTAGSTGVLNEAACLPKPISDVELECSPIEEVTIPLAVARSLKNIRKSAETRESIRQDSTESGTTVHSCIVDEKGKTQLKTS